jgi:hypothetical protein
MCRCFPSLSCTPAINPESWICLILQSTVLLELFWFNSENIQALALVYPFSMCRQVSPVMRAKQIEPMALVFLIAHHTFVFSARCYLLPKNQCRLYFKQYVRLFLNYSIHINICIILKQPCKKFLFCSAIQKINFNQFCMVQDLLEILYNLYEYIWIMHIQ